MNEILAVIVTYNRCELLKKCIRGVLLQEGISCDVLVVDNASSDGTSDYLRELKTSDSRLNILHSKINEGGQEASPAELHGELIRAMNICGF